LGNEFVKGALEAPPESMKNMKPNVWKNIPEKKRIEIHVSSYVRAIHPEHVGYSMDIL
jgi:hypothetical protein